MLALDATTRRDAVDEAVRVGAAPSCTRPTATPRARRRSTPSASTSPGRRGDSVKLAALTHDGEEVWRREVGPLDVQAWLRHLADRGRRPGDRGQRQRRARASSSALDAADAATSRWRRAARAGKTVVRDAVRVEAADGSEQIIVDSTAEGWPACRSGDGERRVAGADDVSAGALRQLADRRRRAGARRAAARAATASSLIAVRPRRRRASGRRWRID